jgi:hypothetical protein
MWRNHKPYLINIGMFYYMIGYYEVPCVNGIKTAKIQPDVHGAKIAKGKVKTAKKSQMQRIWDWK